MAKPWPKPERKPTKARPSIVVILGAAILAFFLLLRLYYWIMPSESMLEREAAERAARTETAAAAAAEQRLKDAWIMAQGFVEDRLKTPSTARFPLWREVTITDQGDGRFVIVAYVDSQNSLGAVVRTNFGCEMVNSGGSWTMENFSSW